MSCVDTPFGPLSLEREPPAGKAALQAWDAADLQLLEALQTHAPPFGTVLVVNDAFGALALGAGRVAGSGVVSWGDSFVAHSAACTNALANNATAPSCVPSSEIPGPVSGPSPDTHAVLLRLPKSLALLANQIAGLHQCLDPATPIWIGAMQKHVPQRAVAFLERHLGPMERQRLQGKAIIWRTRLSPDRAAPAIRPVSFRLSDPALRLESNPAVFNGGRLDAGTRLMLAHRHRWPQARHAADLGCGNGVLGLALAAMRPDVELWGFDDSYLAIASARSNASDADTQHFNPANIFANSLPGQSPGELPRFDLILCNPPFHQQHTVGDHIAWRMFLDSKARLAPGGELWIVGNRHLGYHQKLKRLFGNCEPIAADRRFVVMRSRRR